MKEMIPSLLIENLEVSFLFILLVSVLKEVEENQLGFSFLNTNHLPMGAVVALPTWAGEKAAAEPVTRAATASFILTFKRDKLFF